MQEFSAGRLLIGAGLTLFGGMLASSVGLGGGRDSLAFFCLLVNTSLHVSCTALGETKVGQCGLDCSVGVIRTTSSRLPTSE